MTEARIEFSAGLVHFAPSTGIFRTMVTDGADALIQDFPASPGLLIRRIETESEGLYTLETYNGQEIGDFHISRTYPIQEGNLRASLLKSDFQIDGIGLSDILDISSRHSPIDVQEAHSYRLDFLDLERANYKFRGAVILCIEPFLIKVDMFYDAITLKNTA